MSSRTRIGAAPGVHSVSPRACAPAPRPATPRSPRGPATSSRGLGAATRPALGLPGSVAPCPTTGPRGSLLSFSLGRVLGLAIGLLGLLLRGVLGGRVLRLSVLRLSVLRLSVL